MKMYVGNLSFETTENDLQDLFEQHGHVDEVRLMMDRMTGKSRGFAFVRAKDRSRSTDATWSTTFPTRKSAGMCSTRWLSQSGGNRSTWSFA